jgi:hypothetical protein
MDFDDTSQHPRFTEVEDSYLWECICNAIARSPSSNLDSECWVKLRRPPGDCSFDEALLMCQASSEEWVAWVPDVGTILLQSHEFYD